MIDPRAASALAIVACAAIAGCAHGAAQRHAAATPRPRPSATHTPIPIVLRTLSPKADDAQLAVRVKTALATQVGMNAFRVSVRASHGTVTLEGRAPSAGIARDEEATARDIPGVERLVSRIRIEP